MNICIDRGGTFTDCFATFCDEKGTEREIKIKVLSDDNSPIRGIKNLLNLAYKETYKEDELISSTNIKSIRMATTVATNALLERKGEKFAFLVTKGFKDLLRIGNQSRPNIFDLSIETPNVLYHSVVEIDERVTISSKTVGNKENVVESVIGVSGEEIDILRPLNVDKTREKLVNLYRNGYKTIAVSLLHSFTFPKHEEIILNLAKEIGFENVFLSSSFPMVKIVPRASSTCVDAYLTPSLLRYIQGFSSGFTKSCLNNIDVLFMQSDGGLTTLDKFSGLGALLSGPAGGLVGYAETTFTGSSVIGFDMGGTSTDISRFDGQYSEVLEGAVISGITIYAPQLDISTVAAGGGSVLSFRNGLFCVGPESAGSHPGPTCYGKNGPLTVTDANLVLGRIIPSWFPSIFGPSKDKPLDLSASLLKFKILTNEINSHLNIQKSIQEIAYGFIRVANESMCRPIRTLSTSRGYDIKDHVLACFGGAGGQHACEIAKILGIKKIFIHRHSSILSAYGLALANYFHDVREPIALKYSPAVHNRIDILLDKCKQDMISLGFPLHLTEFEINLNMRYEGTDSSVFIMGGQTDNFRNLFSHKHLVEYGFIFEERDILVDDIHIRGIGKTLTKERIKKCSSDFGDVALVDYPKSHAKVYYEQGYIETPVYDLTTLKPDIVVKGPSILLDQNSTLLIEPRCTAFFTKDRNLEVSVQADIIERTTQFDPVQLSIFAHRFMNIAEQMGKTLQRTSVSTNIKERLDFSCALFGPDGSLIANAPHIPVHLGSMQEAVKFQNLHYRENFKPGVVVVSNHPMAGGSHLPDITVISPVFNMDEIVFFVASRGHHADIGGITPGSMPPNSTKLKEEGAAIKSFKLVEDNHFQEEGISKILLEQGEYLGTRCLKDNISDLKAQVAANNYGIKLVQGLIGEFSLDVVHAYMKYITDNAEESVKELLKSLKTDRLKAIDYLDDGSPICLTINIRQKEGTAEFDFSGTGCQLLGNLNAPVSVTKSAVIYCLRCLVSSDIPLNQGCLAPISFKIPENCLLNPSEGVGVVGGNVLTSQRVVDVILKAFRACAASQGCMNNLTFGTISNDGNEDSFGYYETIAGGAGAGPSWDGKDGVHTHMTNTKITDPEILERRYPVILWSFCLRENSGGSGLRRGGEGVIREIEFLRNLQVSILSERRSTSPYGMSGGGCGKPGLNLLLKYDEISKRYETFNVGGKKTFLVEKHDRIRILTPGGGGYGKADE